MSVKEADRYAVIQRVLAGDLSQIAAAAQIQRSVRQVKRLTRAVREHGASALISKRRGQPSNRRIDEAQRLRLIKVVREQYADFGPELAAEYLRANHDFKASVETLRGWMIADGLWQAKVRRAKRVHSPRMRRACLGELVQIDGSHHAWFEERGPKCCLTAFIDDATGRVLGARFSPTETTQAYFDVLHQCIQTHGVPLALYSDRHSIFTKHDPEDPKPTQFERALLQLQIEPIQARSPQAKGRVERLFQTLQDRLCKALRLGKISGIEAANAWIGQYIEGHNQRFGVAPRSQEDAHRAWTGTAQALLRICAHHHQRQLGSNLSCQFEGQILQVHPHQDAAPKGRAQVDIAQYGDGRLELLYRGQALTHTRHDWHSHLSKRRTADDKTLNDRVDQVVEKARGGIARVMAEIEHQNVRRAQGIQVPNSRASNPPCEGSARYGLRPSQAEPSQAST